MPDPYTQVNLTDVPDDAPANGFADRWEARRWRTPLQTEQTGLTHFRLRPGKRSPISHRHTEAEEVYIILSGTGQIKLDDQLDDVHPLDAIRVAPNIWRAFEAGADGLEILAVGPYRTDDGEGRDDPWVA